MKHARDILNEIKWRDELELEDTVVYYEDRVRPELGFIEGKNIRSWDKSFIYTDKDSAIPFHRVEVIVHKNDEMYRRGKKDFID
jgi:uncharacterized protein (UPF0248 family)